MTSHIAASRKEAESALPIPHATVVDGCVVHGDQPLSDKGKQAVSALIAATREKMAESATGRASSPASAGERTTFTIPDGHVAVRDEEGRATGETRQSGGVCWTCGGSGTYWNGLLHEARPCIDCKGTGRASSPASAGEVSEAITTQGELEQALALPPAPDTAALVERLWSNPFGPKDLSEVAIFVEEERRCQQEVVEALQRQLADFENRLTTTTDCYKATALKLFEAEDRAEHLATQVETLRKALESVPLPSTNGGWAEFLSRFYPWLNGPHHAALASTQEPVSGGGAT